MKTLPLPDNWIDRPVSIFLVGAGGTGSQLADALGSLQATLMALGHPGFNVAVFDPDTVSESVSLSVRNIKRKRNFPHIAGRSTPAFLSSAELESDPGRRAVLGRIATWHRSVEAV